MSTSAAPASTHDLHAGITRIVEKLARDGGAAGTPRVELTRPAEEKFGDYATNVALMLAPVLRSKPRDIAEQVAEQVRALPGVASVDVAGPGFVNITLADEWFIETSKDVLAAGNRFGANSVTTPQKINLEFISANPTGPLVAVAARYAAYGDSLARMLRFVGHDVDTEFYVNDAGRQVQLLGESVVARAAGKDVPEGGYEGDYVYDLAKELNVSEGDDPADVAQRAIAHMMAGVEREVERMGVHFDRYQSEKELHDSGIVDEGIAVVTDGGHTYVDDGATFLRTTSFKDDKDRAIVRSNGAPTYFAADIGYLLHKYRRGSDQLIYVLGADHHGYIARLKAAAQSLGYDESTCEIVIGQMVHLSDGGEQKKMSKRRGEFVLLSELLDRIGIDATRFLMLQRSLDQQLDLDLEQATEQSDKNPVYYVQYAHARLCSIRRKVLDELGIEESDAIATLGTDVVELHPSERNLVKRVAEFPVVVADAAERRQPHRIPHYLGDLAADVARFYRDCRVMGDGIGVDETRQRLALAAAARTVIATGLDLIGVSAPERM
jgi:arginyl-tRNA synthetase